MPAPFDPAAHPDAALRGRALEAFAESAPRALAVQAAADALADADPGVRERAARCLAALGGPDAARAVVPHIASRDLRVRNRAGEVLVALGADAVDALADAVDDPDKDVRKFAVDVLALLPAAPLAGRIAARLEDEDPNVVLAAVDALGALGPAPYAPRLRALYDAMPLARPSVVAALGASPAATDADLDLFERALADDDPVVQFAAADALAANAAPHALEKLAALVPAVPEPAQPLVLEAVVRLVEAAPERAGEVRALRPYLVAMLDDLDAGFRRAAVHGLALIAAGGGGGADEPLLDALLRHAGADDALDVAIFGAIAGHPAALPRLYALTHADAMTADTASNFVLGLLAQGAADEAAWPDAATFIGGCFDRLGVDIKLAAIDLSQRLQHPALHPVVTAGLADHDATVRAFAADAALGLGLDTVAAAPPSSSSRAHA